MKKTYSAPVMDIEKFDVIDVITDSAVATASAVNGKEDQFDELVGFEW